MGGTEEYDNERGADDEAEKYPKNKKNTHNNLRGETLSRKPQDYVPIIRQCVIPPKMDFFGPSGKEASFQALSCPPRSASGKSSPAPPGPSVGISPGGEIWAAAPAQNAKANCID